MISYEGFFLKKEASNLIHSLEPIKLAKTNDYLHCTFKYRPNNNKIFNEIVEKTFKIYIIAYIYDGQISSFEIMLPDKQK